MSIKIYKTLKNQYNNLNKFNNFYSNLTKNIKTSTKTSKKFTNFKFNMNSHFSKINLL